MDIGLGGVPIMEPSETALKYLMEHVKTLTQEELPSGAHLRSRRVLEGLRGHKLCRKDLEESFEVFYTEKRNSKKEDLKPLTCSGLTSHRRQKPGAGIGWTEPRNEKALGLRDIRKQLEGYIGGVKLRESVFAKV